MRDTSLNRLGNHLLCRRNHKARLLNCLVVASGVERENAEVRLLELAEPLSRLAGVLMRREEKSVGSRADQAAGEPAELAGKAA